MFVSATLLTLSVIQAVEVEPSTNNTLAVTGARAGLQADLRYGARVPLFERDGQALFEGTGLKAQATLSLTPAYLRTGARITFTPLAIVDVQLHAGDDRYFGNHQTVVGYSSPDINYGNNKDIAAYVETNGNQNVGSGYHYGIQTVLKAKVGPIVFLGSADWTHWNIQSDVDGEWFFEREKEVMLALGGDETLDTNLLLLYQHDVSPDRFLRAGSITTYRQGIKAQDQLLRSGLFVSLGLGKASHNLIVQPYFIDRHYGPTNAPYTAYAFRYQY